MSTEDIARQTTALMEESRRRLESSREIITHVHMERALFRAMPSIWPCGGNVTSFFGFRIHPMYYSNEFHSGLDIANNKDTPIHATSDGIVKVGSWQPGYGRMVLIDHGYHYNTLYSHMSRIVVNVGDRVARGQVIGYMGSTGTSTGNHVHYEVRFKDSPVNPTRFLRKTVNQITERLNS
jgi:murein DD-endopeptidase MepM/ murein hydrolase activator NlpD